MRIAIFGSCVSRDPFSFVDAPDFEIKTYIARTSFIDLFSAPIEYDDAWYLDLKPFERRCVEGDLGKRAFSNVVRSDFDFLIIDLIDERFDLIEIGGRLVSDTKHMRAGGFEARYREEAKVLPRLSPESTARWKAGFTRTLAELEACGIAQSRIIMHEAVWAAASRDRGGHLIPHRPPYDALTCQHNALLEEYFAHAHEVGPEIRRLRPPAEVVYADPDHRWSKEPFHYVPEYYAAFINMIRALS